MWYIYAMNIIHKTEQSTAIFSDMDRPRERQRSYDTAYVAAAAKSLQSCLTLCDPIDGSPPGSPVPGILQARTLEWVAISFPTHESEKWKWSRSGKSESEAARSCLTLTDPMDRSLLGSSIHGIFQARIPEWGAIAFSNTPYTWN